MNDYPRLTVSRYLCCAYVKDFLTDAGRIRFDICPELVCEISYMLLTELKMKLLLRGEHSR